MYVVIQTSEKRNVHDGNVCSIWGDPHFRTFDGYRYNFMGFCSYHALSWCGPKNNGPLVTIDTKNHRQQVGIGNGGKHTRISSIRMRRRGPATNFVEVFSSCEAEITKNGVTEKFLPEDYPVKFGPGGNLGELTWVDHVITLKVRLRYTAVFDCKEHRLDIELDPFIRDIAPNNVCGLCGNYNANKYDDLPGGKTVEEWATDYKDPESGCGPAPGS
ncbi:BMP-binding endothelial regulator protein-like [Saccoglossus kowalevskii]